MDLLDVLIILFGVSAIIGGYRLGFIARAASWVGLVIGLAVAAHFLPDVVDALRDSPASDKLLIVAATLIGAGFVGQALGLIIGSGFHRRLPQGPLRQGDRVAGALAGELGVAIHRAGSVGEVDGTFRVTLRDAAIEVPTARLRDVYFNAIPRRMGD